MSKILVTGAGGFIGGHMVKHLLQTTDDHIIAVDNKKLVDWDQVHMGVESIQLDMRDLLDCGYVMRRGIKHVYNFAADMGGMGFIETHKADCMLSVLINTNLLLEGERCGVQRYFFASSACVYNADKQSDTDVTALKEEDAYPALCEDGYGWEKLFSERMCSHFEEEGRVPTRVARFHNVYGPQGTWDGVRAKAPAAICRKVATAKLTGEHHIDVWGDGHQTRSFMYIDDCITGVSKIMGSDILYPINLGSSELVSVNELVSIVEDIAGITLERHYDLTAPQGVRGRNSDNTLIKQELGWEPSITLREGLEKTYAWIFNQIAG